ncbi:MAG TPA: choice-of-anchor L domain-containing protein [bacterium]|nr:choice-of-anchor L domain-containing protein [bacterium]
MKKIGFIFLLLAAGIFMLSCTVNDDGGTDTENAVNDNGNTTQDKEQTGDDEGSENDTEKPDIDEGGMYVECTPGETRECFEGPSGSKNVGICQAGIATCVVDGTDWSECVGQVLPEAEICGDGIDQNCDGEDTTDANVIDIDGDGFNYCNGDCCETTWECTIPERVGPSSFEIPENGVDDNCDGNVDEKESCDSGLSEDSTDPMDMAKAMGICPVTETKGYGLVSAEMLFPDGTATSQAFQVQVQDAQGNTTTIDCSATPPNPDSYAILSKFGNVIAPHEGSNFFMMSSGIADDPIPAAEAKQDGTSTEFMCTRSNAPVDWYTANGNQFPSSPGCGGLTGGDPGKEPLNDPVMLQVKVKVPKNAGSFSVDIYFFSREFPEYVCQYNDFFVALLDSTFTSSDINLQNPMDKNLARDEFNNPVGINLAKAGLFRVCCNGGMLACGYDPTNNYSQFCTLGPGELDGTGLYGDDKNGGTGWLITRGNVVPGEEITLRFAIWDALDHILDSEIILDNFQWYESNKKPGTDDK